MCYVSIVINLPGDHAEDFSIDKRGTLTVVNSNLLDRESTPVVAVTVMAFDGLHSSTVPVSSCLMPPMNCCIFKAK